MRDFQLKTNLGGLPDSNIGTKYGGNEVSSLRTEAKTAVERAGLTLAPQDGTGEDQTQLAQSLFINGVSASAFQDGGAADAISLTPLSGSSGLLLPPDLTTLDGAEISFFAAFANLTGTPTASIGQTGGTQFGAKTIVLEDGTALSPGDIDTVIMTTLRFDAGPDKWILIRAAGLVLVPTAQEGAINANLSLDVSVAANALTIEIKDFAGIDPSPLSAVGLFFRSPTPGTGTITKRSLTSTNSLVVPSGAELGVIANKPFKLWFVALDDSGVEIGVVKTANSTSILGLRDNVLQDAVAVDATADAAKVIYAPSLHTDDPSRVMGYAEWSNGLAVPGTWDVAPDIIETWHPGIPLPGDFTGNIETVVKTDTFSTTNATYTDVTGLDVTTIPQNKSDAVLVSIDAYISEGSGTAVNLRLVRGSTPLHVGDVAGSRVSATIGVNNVNAELIHGGSATILDFPESAVAITYKAQMRRGGTVNTSVLNRSGGDADDNDHSRVASNITLRGIMT